MLVASLPLSLSLKKKKQTKNEKQKEKEREKNQKSPKKHTAQLTFPIHHGPYVSKHTYT